MQDQACVFCKIISGQIPAEKIYEDDLVLAILDHRPVREGHTMVIPKKHIDHFIDLDDDLAGHICKVGNLLGKKIQTVLKPQRVGFVVSGFGVPHAHYHVIPLFEKHDITSSQYISKEFGEVTFNMDRISAVDGKRESEFASLLRC